MARTRHSFKKGASGTAPRKRALECPENDSVSAKKTKGKDKSPLASSENRAKPEAVFCNRCDDGGVTLVECDRCERVHCANCISFDVSEEELEEVYYLCYQCHIEDDRAREPEPYMGLYERKLKPDGTAFPGDPLRSKFLPIRQLPSGVPSQRVVTAPLAIIHLHLSTCVTTSTEFCSSIVKPYFYGDILKRRLLIKEIQFDFGTTKEKKEYEKAVTTLIKQLNNLAPTFHPKGNIRPSVAGKRALIMISTHSEDDRGDLFVEPEGSHSHEDFFSGVLPARLLAALANFEITLFFM
ncbi:hypothetical protein DENSPDRAFT_855737, partial [Dentipellis sp. KUC8613]